ncbi:hypothetical protein [Clavibacter michiganensis]|uniref:hypothetical protein n=1 Tax=Clavibacter michiganensis TaxID=28447 RepID=UPI0005BA59FD|nr:hypothetical protein [Clavibacter michiganensis]
MSDDADDIPTDAPAVEAAGAEASDDHDVAEELVSRLELIEGQPLGERAASFALLHDELRARLEGGDGAASRG